MGNERVTEDYVRTHFKQDPLFNKIKFDEQKTRNERIKNILSKASKKNTGKPGYPEFIITFPSLLNSIIVVECKSNLKDHEHNKDDNSNPEKYAVDGVLHYASFLKDEFNVIAIAVSGEKHKQLLISNFFINQNSSKITKLPDNKLLSIYDYLEIFNEKDIADKLKDENLLQFASELNERLHNYSVPENERATIVSGILTALQNKTFRSSYSIEKSPLDLVEDMLTAIERVLKDNKMGKKITSLMGEYKKIKQSNKLSIFDIIRNNETGIEEKNTLLRDIIYDIDKKVFPFTEQKHLGYDILGQFYSEFIRYANGDKKLGLVLTPPHITELFVEIADLNVGSVVYDNCCGTAGFLISAMKKLLSLAGNDITKKKNIKENQVIGVEERPDMFTYACSNMMMRGDGKSNIFLGDSLSDKSKTQIKKFKPTVGLLNPPYSTVVSELDFVYYNLECLERNGICVAILPMNCLLAQTGKNHELKKKLMEHHTLEAVFSMPDQLFTPIGVIVSIIVFKAKIPHDSKRGTWFGYWKDDGFKIKRNIGRIDSDNRWAEIEKKWIDNYRNKKVIPGFSVLKKVTADNEWCAEAYMETDYSDIKSEEFELRMKKYFLFKELGETA